MPLAHPQQRSSLHAAQLLLPMQLNRISDPGHPDLRQHAIPPAKTGQIVCSQTRTYLVSATRLENILDKNLERAMLMLLSSKGQDTDADPLGTARKMRRFGMAPPGQPAATTAAAPVWASA